MRGAFPGHMRHRGEVDTSLTDKELFEQVPLGDPWIDGCLYEVWNYLYQNRHLAIPASWVQTMRDFDQELTALAAQ